MKKRPKKFSQIKPVWYALVGLVGLVILITVLLQGSNVVLFNSKGLIALKEYRLMMLVVAILLDIAVPSLLLFYHIAWKYRESNLKAIYDPQVRVSKRFVFSIWAVPTIFMLVLASVMWPATRELAPQKAIAANAKPITIQVVALRWKWLFIYPEQNIATVNYIQVPVDTPLQFELTADEIPISSFWIPQLGGQLYALTGRTNQLNLITDTPGDYDGRSAEINGAGYAGMKFTARASSKGEFDQWVKGVKQSPSVLDKAGYEKLLKPSENNPVALYAKAEAGLYSKLLMKYSSNSSSQTEPE